MTDTVIYPWNTETFHNAWEAWKAYRKQQHNFTYKSIGEQVALKKLSKLASGSEKLALLIIEQSMSEGWKGLFHLQQNYGRQTTQSIYNRIAARQDWDSL